MYAISTHVQQVHHPPYNNHAQVNGNDHAHPPNPNSHHQPSPITQPNRPAPSATAKEPIVVVGIPSVSIQNNRLQVGNSQSNSTRTYTPLKVLGDGSFGTVWLCDWHGTLPPNTPLSPMQCGAGARPEWTGKRLVAVKRMKRKWEGGWDECKRLKELESLRAIPFHPNIIPLYDFFLLPASKELYFVFESMEGNLYHLIKARKGRALAGGLVASIFRQIVSGLFHIHSCGYFHRDMKPENVLVTTTGLFDYQSVSPVAPRNAPPEKDVVAIIKLADFGLARETKSKPPYTEYVATRWYRAPEVLLLSRDYSNPVDMWALGTIMAELVNLRPLFPGSGQIDQVARICECLGDPTDEYGVDSRGKIVGGGKWTKGIKMAKTVGFAFPKIQPKDFYTLFDRSIPTKLIDCIADLLRYDPDARLTSRQCLEHPYLLETIPRNNIPMPAALQISTSPPTPSRRPNGQTPLSTASQRSVPPSHSHHSVPKEQHASSIHLQKLYGSTESSANDLPIRRRPSVDMISEEPRNGWQDSNGANDWDVMDITSPRSDMPSGYPGHPMDIQTSPMAQEHPSRPAIDHVITGHEAAAQSPGNKLGKFGSLGFKKTSKWGLGGMFGNGDKSQTLPPVDEMQIAASSSSTPSLKRTQSSSTDSRSLSEMSPIQDNPVQQTDPKKIKKDAERVQRDAEKQRRALAEKRQREQAQAVMQKRQILSHNDEDILWKRGAPGSQLSGSRLEVGRAKSKRGKSPGPIRQNQGQGTGGISTTTLNAAAGRFGGSVPASSWKDERFAKARRRDLDDDHSMSSSDVRSSRMSAISFASVDSDPGPSVIRNRPSIFGINRMQSATSLRTGTASFDDFPSSARSSNSFSVGESLAHDFSSRANVDGQPLSGTISPPPMQMLSLSPNSSWHPHSPSEKSISLRRENHPTFIPMPPPLPQYPSDISTVRPHSPCDDGSLSNIPSSPGINPMFKVNLHSPLPPFSHLEAVAEGEYPPVSPMSFRENSPFENAYPL